MNAITSLAGVLPVVVLVPLFAISDRLFGAERPAFKGKKAAILALAIAGGFLAGGITGAMFGFGWFMARVLPWPDNAQTPRNAKEFGACALRCSAVALPVALIAHWRALDVPHTAMAFGAYVAACVVLHAVYGRALTEAERDIEAKRITAEQANENLKKSYGLIEAVRGACFGAAAVLALSWA